MRSFLILTLVCFFGFSASSQCNLTVTSTDGYVVHIELSNFVINAPSTCPFGYNYSVSFDHNIYFTGSNIPSALWNFQGDLDCDNPNMSFHLPNAGGMGTTTTANTWRPMSDCATATPSLLNCNNIDLIVSGPGIVDQNISCALGIVPIELSNFSLQEQNRTVIVSWETATEINNDFFTIEKSSNTLEWKELATRSSEGNASRYSVTDEDPILGKSYYRLKQTDLDGKYTYSTIEAISIKTKSYVAFKVYPNPVSEILYVERNDELTGSIEIFNAIGNKINLKHNGTEQDTKTSIDIATLESGVYYVKIGNHKAKFYKI